jgi:uncharacterized protein YndB with AHSA1/START domain
MTDLSIHSEIIIDAPAEVVWRTITEPAHIEQWFADRVELDLRPGGHGSFVFTEHARSKPTTAPLVVEAVDPPRRFAFRWAHPDGATPGPGTSVLVEFTLAVEASARTRLTVVETGLSDMAWPEDDKTDYAREHREGWATHLGRLGALLGVG